MKLFEDETHGILLKFLDNKVRKAEEEIEEKGVLSDEFAIPLLLKTQFNHIAHLDEAVSEIQRNMATKDDLKGMATKDDIKHLESRNNWTLGLLSIVIMLIAFAMPVYLQYFIK